MSEYLTMRGSYLKALVKVRLNYLPSLGLLWQDINQEECL